MTHQHLLAAEESRAFEATRRFEDLYFFHVPFDELNGDNATEDSLTRLVRSRARVAVVGPSGCGKSSVISSVLGPLSTGTPDNAVPLRIPVAAVTDDVVVEPSALARHIVRYVTRWASRESFTEAEQAEFDRGVAEVLRRSSGGKRKEFHIGLPLWLARAGFAREVQSAGEDYEEHADPSDSVEHLRRMVALFEAHDLAPVLVFDDSDAWLSIPGFDRLAVANAFFSRAVRMLAKDIDVAIVMAIHQTYLELDGYRAAEEWLSARVDIPRLLEPRAGISAIFRDRLVMAEVDAGIDDIIDEDAIDGLAKFYDSGRTLRDILRVAQRGLQDALSAGEEIVSFNVVEQAIAELAH